MIGNVALYIFCRPSTQEERNLQQSQIHEDTLITFDNQSNEVSGREIIYFGGKSKHLENIYLPLYMFYIYMFYIYGYIIL